jgi:phenylacetate-CoA ligase
MYASTELATSFTEFSEKLGGHTHLELINCRDFDENNHSVHPGQPGEVVATLLQVTGMPLLRYVIGDMAAYHTEPCPCCKNSFRLGLVIGRKQHKLKVQGTTLYPSTIFSVLHEISEVKNYYLEIYGEYELSEAIRVVVGVENANGLSAETIAEKIRGYVRVKPQVVI